MATNPGFLDCNGHWIVRVSGGSDKSHPQKIWQSEDSSILTATESTVGTKTISTVVVTGLRPCTKTMLKSKTKASGTGTTGKGYRISFYGA